MNAVQIGSTLGPYLVIEQIGEGGMARVYKAYQPSMERYVALKVLSPHSAEDSEFRRRFIREARTIAQLEHKNILPVYDFGEQQGVAYLAMRYLEGGTLKDVLGQGRLTTRDILKLMTQTCAALDYAHRKGVVHRDVKPSNVIIDSEGEAYLTDFGIARVLGGDSDLTRTGVALGTPDYMAPEQCMGQPVDRRADIYALGVMLYEMVVGRVPFRADTPMAVALAHINEPLTLPRQVDPSIPESLEAVIIKALAKDSDHRYQSAAELAEALERAIQTSGASLVDSTLATLVLQAQEARATRDLRKDLGVAAAGQPDKGVPRRRMSPLWVAGLFLGAAALVFLGAYAGVWLFSRLGGIAETEAPASTAPVAALPSATLAEEPTALAPASPSASPGETLTATIAEVDLYMYDSFDNPADEGGFSTTRWAKSDRCAAFTGGGYVQRDGVLQITNQAHPQAIGCDLFVQRPAQVKGEELGAFEAQLHLSSEHNGGYVESYLTWEAWPRQGAYWEARCDQRADENGVFFAFEIKHQKAQDAPLDTLYFRSAPGDYDRWYTLRLENDPATMTYRCLVDGHAIGEYTPENLDELRGASFNRTLVNVRDAGVIAMATIDDVRLVPPEALTRVASAPEEACLPPPAGMIAWWPGEGNAHDLVGRYHGVPVNGADFAPGLVGEAFHFDWGEPGEFIKILDIIDSAQLQVYTIETWVRLDTLNSPAERIERFVTIGVDPEAIVLRHNGSGQLHYYMLVDEEFWHLSVDGVLRVGVFQHVAATYDGSAMRLYLDGVEVGSLAYDGGVNPGDWFVTLSTETEPLRGLLDEVSLYNRPLSPDEILAIYQAGNAGKCKP